MSKSSHLQLEDRNLIEEMLNDNHKLCEISIALSGRDPRGIKYEIMQHRKLTVRANAKNPCGIQHKCKVKRLCNDCESGLCKHCGHVRCSDYCENFQQYPDCKRIKKYPCVCNGCFDIKVCSLPKVFYKASIAQEEYERNITEHKYGPSLSEVELKKLDQIISDGVKKNQSIDVIIHTNNLDIATSTVYKYIDNGDLSVKNIDLKRKIRYRIRKTNKPKANPHNYDYLKGRTREDFLQYILDNPDMNVWQMDTVEGTKGGSGVLSLLFTKTNLQLYFKIDSISAEEIIRIFSSIKKYLGPEIFKEVFACILTDNGTEFRKPEILECDEVTGEQLIRIFYCHPRRSDQKAKCEKNHEHFREFIPKGKSMDNHNKNDINFISKHINNYPRKKYGYHSPYECSISLLNKKVFELNRLDYVSPDKVVLKHLIK